MNAILIYNELNLIFTRINIFPRFLYDLIYFTKSNLISGDSKTSQTVVKASWNLDSRRLNKKGWLKQTICMQVCNCWLIV